jgi:hypothetical protein
VRFAAESAAAVGVVLASVLGLVTYEAVVLVFAATGMVSGLAALVWCAVNALRIRDINDRQAQRIERIIEPGG